MTTKTYWSFDLYEEKQDPACKTSNNNYLNLNKMLNYTKPAVETLVLFYCSPSVVLLSDKLTGNMVALW